MKTVKEQAALDSSLQTAIELFPKKVYFGSLPSSGKLAGYFTVKNKGQRNFNIVSIASHCDCFTTSYGNATTILPGDSLKVSYQLHISNSKGRVQNSIIVIGNCPNGNQTFYIEGTIINN